MTKRKRSKEVALTVRLSEELLEAVRDVAVADARTVASLVRLVLAEEMERRRVGGFTARVRP